jgi:hypothetical protein
MQIGSEQWPFSSLSSSIALSIHSMQVDLILKMSLLFNKRKMVLSRHLFKSVFLCSSTFLELVLPFLGPKINILVSTSEIKC